MREILFRGKRIDGNNNWAYGSLIIAGDKAYIINKDNVRVGENNTLSNTSIQPVKPETVGQFTGLLDKNVTKIFEGDILIIGYNGLGSIVVEFYEGIFNASRYVLSSCHVSSNIHDKH